MTQDDALLYLGANAEHNHAPLDSIVIENGATDYAAWHTIFDHDIKIDSPFTANFSITKPPQSLIKVLRLLQQENVDIGSLSHAVENEPSFSNFIKQTATQGNRMSLPVVTVKQGIMTHGIERLGDMLVAHAMLSRFMQSEFPLRKTLSEFVHIYTQICAELAARTSVMLPQSASLIGLVVNAALFTHPSLKTQTRWQHATSQDSAFHFDGLIQGCSSGTFAKAAMTLAKSWHLSKRHIHLITQLCSTQSKRPVTPSIALFHLSLLWSKYVWQGRQVYSDSIDDLERPLFNALSLSKPDRRQVIESVSDSLQCALIRH